MNDGLREGWSFSEPTGLGMHRINTPRKQIRQMSRAGRKDQRADLKQFKAQGGPSWREIKREDRKYRAQVNKSLGDWKNIEQRKVEARNGRRAKRQGLAVTGVGAGAAAAGAKQGGGPILGLVGREARHTYRTARDPGGLWRDYDISQPPGVSRSRAAKYAAHNAKNTYAALPGKAKAASAALAGGSALAAGGLGLAAHGAAKERYNEHRIAQMRRRNAARRSVG